MALPNRKDVASELTWDLTPLYPNDEAWAADLVALKQLVTDLVADFDGHLTTTEQILAGLTALEKIEQKASLIEHYAFLHQASDMTDPHYNHLLKQAEQALAFKNAKLAFFDIQVSQNQTATLDEVATKEPRFASVIRHLKAEQKHLLDPKTEAALALLGPTLNAPEGSTRQHGRLIWTLKILWSMERHILCHLSCMKIPINTTLIIKYAKKPSNHSLKR